MNTLVKQTAENAVKARDRIKNYIYKTPLLPSQNDINAPLTKDMSFRPLGDTITSLLLISWHKRSLASSNR